MQLLLILLSVMTWTVTDKSSVSGDGLWPYDIEVDYSCSYQKGDVRQGDNAVLTLSHLDGITIERVDVYAKSNKSGGAGVFTVTVDGQAAATKAGTFKEWCGSYDNADFHDINLLNRAYSGVNELMVSLTGTANSLHIEKYVITWTSAPVRTVTLMKGAELHSTMTEEQGKPGITLPYMNDTLDWQFAGWATSEFWTIHTTPSLYPAGSRYYPTEDCTLWAAYKYQPQSQTLYVENLESGVYLYVNRDANIALSGVPGNGRMNYSVIDRIDENQYYRIDFPSADTAYITHVKTGTPIGYSGTKLSAAASPWRVYHNGDQTLFYATINKKNYILWLNFRDNYGDVYTCLMAAEPGNSPMALILPKTDSGELAYTCHPECGMNIVDVSAEDNGMIGEWIFPFGPYKMVIRSGKKYIIIEK